MVIKKTPGEIKYTTENILIYIKMIIIYKLYGIVYRISIIIINYAVSKRLYICLILITLFFNVNVFYL